MPILKTLAAVTAAATVALAVGAAVTAVPPPAKAQDGQGIALVKSLYTAFGKGDVAGILGGLTEDVAWEVVGPASACPCYGVRNGKPSVAAFFKEIAERHDYKVFEPKEFMAAGNAVIVLGRHDMVLRTTGKPFAADWVHVFRIEGGKVASFREFTDSGTYAEAARR